MVRRLVLLVGALGAAVLGATSVAGSADRVPRPAGGLPSTGALLPKGALLPTGCPLVLGRQAGPLPPELRRGAGIWGAAAGGLVRLDDPLAGAARDEGAAAGTVVRHAVSERGVGTAFVRDGAGTDTVVLVTATRTVRIRQRGEAVNPALSARGDLAWSVGSQVRVRDGSTGRVVDYPAPRRGALAFSPVFAGRSIVVAVSAPPTGVVPEDARLDDLWRVSPRGRWRPLTSFSAGADRWTAVRTPMRSPGGGVDFILIRGRASSTVEPRFFLVHLEDGRMRRIAQLDREMYLAGADGRARLWNVPDRGAARIDLVRESPGGATTTIGCGATLMDPIDVADPDRATGGGGGAPPRGPVASGAPGGTAGASEVGILVGDFADARAAEEAASTIRAAGGIGASATVVDAVEAPNALRPGAYGVLLPLTSDADPQAALHGFRAMLPSYASKSWVVSP